MQLFLYCWILLEINRGEIGFQTMLFSLFIFKKFLEVKPDGTTYYVKCKFDKKSHNQKAMPALVSSRSGKGQGLFKGQTHAVASALF